MRCEHPVRGRWGGPPDGHATNTVAARDLAEVQRGGVNLSRVIRSPIPALTYSTSPITPPVTAPVAAPPPSPTRPVAPPPRTRRRPNASNDRGPQTLGFLAGLAAVVGLAISRRRKG